MTLSFVKETLPFRPDDTTYIYPRNVRGLKSPNGYCESVLLRCTAASYFFKTPAKKKTANPVDAFFWNSGRIQRVDPMVFQLSGYSHWRFWDSCYCRRGEHLGDVQWPLGIFLDARTTGAVLGKTIFPVVTEAQSRPFRGKFPFRMKNEEDTVGSMIRFFGHSLNIFCGKTGTRGTGIIEKRDGRSSRVIIFGRVLKWWGHFRAFQM